MSSLLHDHERYLIDAKEFRSFLFQGRANFTMVNADTENYITYYVKSRKVKRDQPEETRFFEVYVKAIGDKVAGKVQVGEIDRKKGIIEVKQGVKSDYIGLVTIKWLLFHWRSLEKFHDKLKIYHLNSCCKCGMPLTVPESIQDGIGPICIITRMNQSLEIMKGLGIQLQEGVDFTKPANYDVAAAFAISKFPDYLDKIYIPARLRRNDEFIGQLYELDKFGLW